MSKFFYFLLVVFIACSGCNDKAAVIVPTTSNEQRVRDSVTIADLLFVNERLNDSIASLRSLNDTLKTNLFLSNYKVEKVKFYLSICMRDKTQDKFLKGWVRRAVE